MARHHMTPDGPIQFTAQEEIDRDAEEAKVLADQPMQAWEQQMASSDNVLPRWAEDLIDQNGIVGLAQATVDKYNGKKSLRATKP